MTTNELRKQLKEHERYDKWWNDLTVEEKHKVYNGQGFAVIASSLSKKSVKSVEVKAPLVNISAMEAGPSFGKEG